MKSGNKLNSTMAHAALAVAASLSWVTTATASSPVTVLNAGFELPLLANGVSSTSAPTSWSQFVGGSVGAWNVQTADYPAEAPEGSNIGYVFGAAAGNGLSQVLTTNFQADSNYSLSVKVGQSLTYPTTGYTVQLVAGSVILTNGQDDNTNPPAAGSFATSTINYIYNAADSALVGQPLEIRLLSKGLDLSGEIDFDDVQLTVTLGSPVALPGGPYNVAAAGSLSLNGSTSLPSEGQTLTTYEWDLNNDGNYGEMISGATPASISYATLTGTHGMGPGANTIRLRVTDDSSPTPKTNVATATVNLPPAPPANDNFANAIDLTGAGAGQTGNLTTGNQTGTYSTSASLEAGEPSPGGTNNNSVWFKWTSPSDGQFTYGTAGSTNAAAAEWDSVIGIYTGASLNALTPLGATPKDTGSPETMTVTVTPGTTYYIQLTGFEGEAATNILLNWSYVATVYQADMLTYGPGAVISPVVANAATISWTVPFGTDLMTFAPTFTLSVGATCTVGGNPVVSGSTPVNFSGGPVNYVVTSQGGAFVNTYTVTITVAPNESALVWNLATGGNWDYVTSNWLGQTSSTVQPFVNTLNVKFDNAAGGAITVVNPNTAPGSITVDSAGTYKFITGVTGAGVANSITSGTLVKNGTGTLQLGDDTLNQQFGSPPNIYSNNFSSITINAGTLKYNSIGSLGTGTLTLAGGVTVVQARVEGRYNSANENINVDVVLSGGATNGGLVNLPMAFGNENKGIWITKTVTGPGGFKITGDSRYFGLSNPGNTFAGGLTILTTSLTGPAVVDFGTYTSLGTGAITVSESKINMNAVRGGLTSRSDLPGDVTYPNGVTNSVVTSTDKFFNVYCATASHTLQLGGVISGGGVFRKWKNASKLILSGTNTYTGGTIVDAGTVLINGNSSGATGPVAVATATGAVAVASLASTLGGTGTIGGNITVGALGKIAPGTSTGTFTTLGTATFGVVGGSLAIEINDSQTPKNDKFVVTGALNITNATLNLTVTGVPAQPAYVIATYGTGLTGTFATIAGMPAGYEIDYAYSGGTAIAIKLPVANPYATWSGGPGADVDTNGDGVKNGVAWVLGAANPAADATGLVPTLDNTTDPDFFIFNYRRSDTAAADVKTAMKVQYGSSLVTWTNATPSADIIITPFNDFYGAGIDKVEVKIRRTLAVGGKLFTRLNVVVTP